MSTDLCDQLQERGFAGPLTVFSREQCRSFLATLSHQHRRPPMDWHKGNAAAYRPFYEIATHPGIVDVVESALGGNVMLWGACVITQKTGGVHPWHSDIETSGPVGKTVSVWIGLENISQNSALQFISHSHRFGQTIQQIRAELGTGRSDATTENVLQWARQRDPRAELVKPAMSEGQAVFFQGQAWHHTENPTGQTRRALLLQYASPDTPIRVPDPNCLDWPFVQRETPKPACIMIRGTDNSGVNKIVPAPPASSKYGTAQLTNEVFPISIPLDPDDKAGFKPYWMFNGSTSDLREMDVHVSVLNQGNMPHPPHTHREEEILIMLSGEADLILPTVKGLYGDDRHPIKPGELVYYPANFPHTLRATNSAPANYLMFKWHADHGTSASPLGFYHFSVNDPEGMKGDGSSRTKLLFEGPTQCLRRLHCHVSILEPGAGYEPHADAYDVAIVMLEGEIETLGQRVRPHATIFHPAGQLHGIRNVGNARAKYIVFEFHGSQAAQTEAFPKPPVSFIEKVADPKRWKHKIKSMVKRATGRK